MGKLWNRVMAAISIILLSWMVINIIDTSIKTFKKERNPFKITLSITSSNGNIIYDTLSVDSFKVVNNNLIHVWIGTEKIVLINDRGIMITNN